MPGFPVCISLPRERASASTAGSSRWVGPVPAYIETKQGREAEMDETVCETRKGGDWAAGPVRMEDCKYEI